MNYDAKRQWLRKPEYTEVTKRLSMRTGWTLTEVEGWLARSWFKACAGNGVMGNPRAREEAIQVVKGGPRGERARAVRAIREDLNKRISGSANPMDRDSRDGAGAAGQQKGGVRGDKGGGARRGRPA